MNNWKNITGIDLEVLKQNRKVLHKAVQIVGAFPRNMLPHDPTDATASLIWNSNNQALESIPFLDKNRSIKVGLLFESFELYVDLDGNILTAFGLNGKSVSEGVAWLKRELAKLSIEAGHLNLKLPYEIENYDYSRSLKVDNDAVLEYKKLYQHTQQILAHLVTNWKDAYDIRCWPHHFDLATLIPLETDADGELLKSIGIGLSPGDEGVEEPYVYVNIWPNVSLGALEKHNLSIGHWNKEGWSGAVLTYSQMLTLENQEEGYQLFIETVIHILNKA